MATDERIVDACAMQLVLNPWQFDVIVTTNLFGDILSGLRSPAWSAASAWRRAPTSASTPRSSRRCTARRRTSPARAWRTRSRSCSPPAMMLDHVDHRDLAGRLRAGIDEALNLDGVRTRDLGGKADTKHAHRRHRGAHQERLSGRRQHGGSRPFAAVQAAVARGVSRGPRALPGGGA